MFDTSGQVKEIFESLFLGHKPTGFAVLGHEWPGHPGAFAAVDEDGAAYLLIRERKPSVTKTELHRHHFHVYGGLSINVRIGESESRGKFSVVKLLSTAREHLQSFAMLTSALMESLPKKASVEEISGLIVRFSRLFNSEAQPERRQIVGLWGELMVIYQSEDPSPLVRGWHSNPTQMFDFSLESQNLEVKTCCEHERRHRFTYEQLSTEVERTSIVSIHAFESNGGLSVADLLSEIAGRLAPDEVEVLLDRTYAVLGTYLEASSDYRYSLRSDVPMAVIPAREFPTLTVSKPELVSHISYVVNVHELAVIHSASSI